jgi:uncharacterized damage-inducible protein DinB
MDWKDLLKSEIEYTYKITDGLINLVDEESLEWKPSDKNNWMTTGQLLHHITDACGAPIKGFVTGDWGLPEGVDIKDLPADEVLPPAEKLPAITSVAEAREMLEKDKQLALDMLDQCSEENLGNQISKAPWDSSEMILGHRILQMISHLSHHKAQLFYYLKLQGEKVNTGHLWGS